MNIIYEDESIQVQENGSGEIIIESKNYDGGLSGNFIRVSPQWNAILGVTAHNSIFTPTSFNGLGGFYISKRN